MPPGCISSRAGAGHPTPALVDAIREPVLALDTDLRVVTTNRAFCLTFGLQREDVLGRPLHALGDGAWNIPGLLALLAEIVPRDTVMKAYEVERDFARSGRRTMLLSAHGIASAGSSGARILLTIEDITERRAAERALNELVHEKDLLLQEIPHRVATCLRIIASFLRSRVCSAASDETRRHVENAHNHVMTLSELQRQLRESEPAATIDVGAYLSRLCETLASTASRGARPAAMQVRAGPGAVSSSQALSIGLAVTELVVNALEHAFPDEQDDASVLVTYDQSGPDWMLAVRDNAIGRPEVRRNDAYPGPGSVVIEALIRRLDATLDVALHAQGRTVSIIHGTAFVPHLPVAGPVSHQISEPDDPEQTIQTRRAAVTRR